MNDIGGAALIFAFLSGHLCGGHRLLGVRRSVLRRFGVQSERRTGCSVW